MKKSYDFREAHPECKTSIVDQRNCSASFAIASASAISDRVCLANKNNNVRLSAQHFLSCQEDAQGNECAGGSIGSFLEFAKKKGLVDESCLAYKGEKGVSCPVDAIEKCEKTYLLDYCVANGVEGIKREIFKNGPVVGYMPVYRDFLVYKSGIYRILEGTSRFQGGHAVKVIGWGAENGEEYWIIENSWGESWGIGGYGRVLIGEAELLLDEYGFAVHPKSDSAETLKTEEKGEAKPEEVVQV